jgi:hypothetical protein
VSKALEKSMIPISTCFPLLNDCSMSWNYRLTSVPCKLLEHIICGHSIKHLEKHSVLTSLMVCTLF